MIREIRLLGNDFLLSIVTLRVEAQVQKVKGYLEWVTSCM